MHQVKLDKIKIVERAKVIERVEAKARLIRRHIVEMIGTDRTGHLGGALSAADVVAALYFYKMNHRPKEPEWEERDRFILSKGHAVPALYAALAESGYFPLVELKTFKKFGTRLQGHPDMRRTPGVEASTGSLGQGLSVGVGLALAARLDKKEWKVYVLLGDGEINEGQVWEAAMAASHYHLDNLVAVVDNNGLQATGFTRDSMNTEPIVEKWRAFRWEVTVIDGHNVAEIVQTLDWADDIKGRPVVIVARTTKGKGVSFAENNPAYHHGMLSLEQYNKALQDIGQGVTECVKEY